MVDRERQRGRGTGGFDRTGPVQYNSTSQSQRLSAYSLLFQREMGPWQQNPRRAVTLQPYEAAGALHSAEHLRRAFQGALAQRLIHKGGCGGPFRVLKRPSARNGYFGLVSYTRVGWTSDDSVEHSPTSFVRICNTSASRASFPSWEPNGRPWQGVPCNREGTSGMLGQETGSVMAGHAYAGGES